MTAILMPAGRLRYHATINGAYGPAVGYKLHTYEAGTTTPKATYTASNGVTPLANPIVLDANGECAPFGFGAYKLKLTDPNGAEVWTQDNVVLTTDTIATEWCGTAGGTADVITLSPAEAITAYASGQRFQFIAASANTTAVTVAVSGLTAKALTWNGNTALAANDLVLGRIYEAQYDGTRFQLLEAPAASAAADDTKRLVTTEYLKDLTASETVAGIVELATAAEAQAGTDTARAVTPAGLRSGLSATGTAPIYAARAWVNFNGTGTVAIRASGNVTSITDIAVGDYVVNFAVAMPDANYAPVSTSYGADGALTFVSGTRHAVLDAASYRLLAFRPDGTSGLVLSDSSIITVAIYR